jgi:hypothetical protein
MFPSLIRNQNRSWDLLMIPTIAGFSSPMLIWANLKNSNHLITMVIVIFNLRLKWRWIQSNKLYQRPKVTKETSKQNYINLHITRVLTIKVMEIKIKILVKAETLEMHSSQMSLRITQLSIILSNIKNWLAQKVNKLVKFNHN